IEHSEVRQLKDDNQDVDQDRAIDTPVEEVATMNDSTGFEAGHGEPDYDALFGRLQTLFSQALGALQTQDPFRAEITAIELESFGMELLDVGASDQGIVDASNVANILAALLRGENRKARRFWFMLSPKFKEANDWLDTLMVNSLR